MNQWSTRLKDIVAALKHRLTIRGLKVVEAQAIVEHPLGDPFDDQWRFRFQINHPKKGPIVLDGLMTVRDHYSLERVIEELGRIEESIKARHDAFCN